MDNVYIEINRTYRKRPVDIKAWEFTMDNKLEGLIGQGEYTNVIINDYLVKKDSRGFYIEIETLEGVMRANEGDFIITGLNGEKYPCKPDIFWKTYHTVLDTDRNINVGGKVTNSVINTGNNNVIGG